MLSPERVSCQIWWAASYVWLYSWAQINTDHWFVGALHVCRVQSPEKNKQPNTLIVLQQRCRAQMQKTVLRVIHWYKMVWICVTMRVWSVLGFFYLTKKKKNNQVIKAYEKSASSGWKRHAQFRLQGDWKIRKNYEEQNMTNQNKQKMTFDS